MQSKRSFFNGTLFRKNLTRFWPLWGGLSLAGSLVPLYMLLALLSNSGHGLSTLDFAYVLYAVAAMAGPVLSLIYAVLCAMLVWGYLYNPRSVGLMHTLPVDRTCLFITSTLSGLAMMVIPYAVVGGLTCLIAAVWGFFDIIAAANTVLAILLMTVTFFGLSTFCAMLTGNSFALPVLYLLVNFLAPLLETLLTGLAGQFLIGAPADGERLRFLAPVLQIYAKLSVNYIRDDGKLTDYYLQGFDTLALYGFLGIALLALAWLLYCRRHSESAGDIAAFPILRPIFRYGLALLSALALGWMVYELLWGALFQPGLYAQAVPMGVCMAITGVIGYYAASMLLEKSLRVFRGSWKGVAAVCVGAAAICAAVSVDIFGIERRVPPLDEVEWVSMGDYQSNLAYSTDTDPELAERLIDIHRSIVADRDYLRSITTDGDAYYHYWTISYRLKSGGLLRRSYHLRFTEERVSDPDTYDGKIAAMLADPEVIVSKIAIPEGGMLTDVMTYDYEAGYGENHLDQENCQRLYEAMLQDAREGNIPGRDILSNNTQSYDFYLEIEYRQIEPDGSYSHYYNTVYLCPTMEHTIAVLREIGALSAENLAQWDRALVADS